MSDTDTCRRGHPLTDGNVYVYGRERRCRECHRIRQRKHLSKPEVRERDRESSRRWRAEASPETLARKRVRDRARERERSRDPEVRARRRKADHARMDARLALIVELKGARCWSCGAEPEDRRELHFHHRDPATKLFSVANGTLRSESVLRAEIAKCDVLCVPCHNAAHRALREAVAA